MTAVSTVRVPADPANVAFIRSCIGRELRGFPGGLSSDLADDVELVISELVGNAMRHASALADGTIRASWSVTSEQVELAVTDGGSGNVPALRAAGPGDTGGRGLSIVSCLARRWGVRQEADGTTVWAQLALDRDTIPTGATGSQIAVSP